MNKTNGRTNMKQLPTTEINVVGEVVVGYKRNEKIKMMEQPVMKTSKDVAKYCQSIYEPSRIEHIEEAFLVLMNRQNRVLGWAKISTGGITGTVIDSKVIFQIALNSNASAIAICHNHPSGNMTPSEADKKLTNMVKQGANILDITLLDHVIISPDMDNYFSFTDEGLL